MKRNPIGVLKYKSTHSLICLMFFLALLPSSVSWARADLDRKFSLETVGYLDSWDNVDGLFTDYVRKAYEDYFAQRGRFRVQNLNKANELLKSSKLDYRDLIHDEKVLAQLTRSTRVESLIRTKITKEGPIYKFVIEWLHAAQLEILAENTFQLDEKDTSDQKNILNAERLQAKIQDGLEQTIKKLPFLGHISGRDEGAVTVNIGKGFPLKKGDILIVGSVEEVKTHPILKTLVDWKFSQVGKVEIEQADERLSFGRVIEEEPGRIISRFQKIIQVIPATQKIIVQNDAKKSDVIVEEQLENPEVPRLGWASGSVWIGSSSRDYSINPGFAKTGGGLLLGAEGQGQLWLTHLWFLEAGFGYGFNSYSQTNADGSGASNLDQSASFSRIKAAGGYTYYIASDFWGPKAQAKIGYHSHSFDIPVSTAEKTGPLSFKSIFLGISGDLPIRNRFGALLALDFGFLSFIDAEEYISAADNSKTDVTFALGAYYRWTPKITIKAGLEIISNSVDFAGGISLTHRVINFTPTLQYYF